MKTPVVKDLLERRVPQYIAIYLGACWGVVEFLAFLEERLIISPHLTNLVLLLLVLLLPSVVMFVYFHGRPGRDRLRRIEAVFVPANVVVASVFLFGAFGGKPLGTVTETVVVEDEEGNVVERTLPRSEFRKSLLLLPFEADSTWLELGVLSALANDLVQDAFLDARDPSLARAAFEEAGYGITEAIPAPLKRSVAQKMGVRYVVDGSVRQEADSFRLHVVLHDAERQRVAAEHNYGGSDLLELIDTAALQLRRDLALPERHLDETPDMLVREHTTGSLDALRSYAEGWRALLAESDYAEAARGFQAALEADPTYAIAGIAGYQTLLFTGDPGGAAAALKTAIDHQYRLPERLQYMAKAEWYAIQQDTRKSFAAYEVWAELFPQDIAAQLAVAQIREFQADQAGAVEALKRVVDLDPSRLDIVHRIGSLNRTMGRMDEAREHFERYQEARPDDVLGLTSLADLERSAGRHDVARDLYERALVLEPEDVELMTEAASLERDVGDFDAALAGLERATDAARSPQQRFEVATALRRYHASRGARALALEHERDALAAAGEFHAPVTLTQFRLLGLSRVAQVHGADYALAQLDSLAAHLPPPLDALVPIGRAGVLAAAERPDELEVAVGQARDVIERTGMKALEQPVVYAEGRLHEIRGDWRAAIAAYERERQLNPTDPTIPTQLGRCYRELGDLERAEALIRETLVRVPADGTARYELARVYEGMGRAEPAAANYRRALEVWAPADSGFEDAARARAALEALQREHGPAIGTAGLAG